VGRDSAREGSVERRR